MFNTRTGAIWKGCNFKFIQLANFGSKILFLSRIDKYKIFILYSKGIYLDGKHCIDSWVAVVESLSHSQKIQIKTRSKKCCEDENWTQLALAIGLQLMKLSERKVGLRKLNG